MNKSEWDIANALTCPRRGIFPFRRYLVVPNVSWGFNLNFECDLIIASNSKVLYEVEIKVSKSDIKRDMSKHRHLMYKPNAHIKHKYFAIPSNLNEESVLEMIPEKCGIIIVDENGRCKKIRKAETNPDYRKITEKEWCALLRLGVMRYWGIRHKMYNN